MASQKSKLEVCPRANRLSFYRLCLGANTFVRTSFDRTRRLAVQGGTQNQVKLKNQNNLTTF